MSLGVFVGLCCAGGAGAATRHVVDGWVRSTFVTRFQWATMVVNLSGSFLLGLLTGLSEVDVVSSEWYLVVGTGLLGGYTTFSTASYETVALIRQRRHLEAIVSSAGMLVACVALAATGLALAG